MSSEQKEKPSVSLDQYAATFGQRPVYASGGMIENFKEGWAYFVMGSGEKAHYYRRDGFLDAISVCGNWAPRRWLYGIGNYPKCKLCQRAVTSK